MLGNAQGMHRVLRVVRGGRVHIHLEDPAHGLSRHDVDADRLEPRFDPGRVVAHVDFEDAGRT
jgi:hypothetical protein